MVSSSSVRGAAARAGLFLGRFAGRALFFSLGSGRFGAGRGAIGSRGRRRLALFGGCGQSGGLRARLFFRTGGSVGCGGAGALRLRGAKRLQFLQSLPARRALPGRLRFFCGPAAHRRCRGMLQRILKMRQQIGQNVPPRRIRAARHPEAVFSCLRGRGRRRAFGEGA